MKIDYKNNFLNIYKLLFAICIAYGHYGLWWSLKDWTDGGCFYLGVEFFFIVSGFFLADTEESKKNETTFDYTIRRFWKLFKYQLLSFLIMYNYFRIIDATKDIKYYFTNLFSHIFEIIPGVYFWRSDISAINYPLWYVSVLIFWSIIIHYMLRNHFEFYTSVVCPCSILIIYNYIFKNCDCLNMIGAVGLFFNIGYLRGLAGMNVGIICYLIIKKLCKYEYKNIFMKGVRLFEYTIFIIIFVIMYKRSPSKYDVWVVMLIFIGVLLSLIRHRQGVSLPTNFNKFIGDLSLGIYLNHVFVYTAVFQPLSNKLPLSVVYFICFIILVILSVIINYIIRCAGFLCRSIKEKFIFG